MCRRLFPLFPEDALEIPPWLHHRGIVGRELQPLLVGSAREWPERAQRPSEVLLAWVADAVAFASPCYHLLRFAGTDSGSQVLGEVLRRQPIGAAVRIRRFVGIGIIAALQAPWVNERVMDCVCPPRDAGDSRGRLTVRGQDGRLVCRLIPEVL